MSKMIKIAFLVLLATTYGQETSNRPKSDSVNKNIFVSRGGKSKLGGTISGSAAGNVLSVPVTIISVPVSEQPSHRVEQQSSKGQEDEGDLEAVIRFFSKGGQNNKGSDGQNGSRNKKSGVLSVTSTEPTPVSVITGDGA